MPTYQPNIPTGAVPLNQDYLNLQGNFQQLNIAYGGDHVPFSDTSGNPPSGQSGMHTIIHLQPQSPPTALAGIGQFYDTTINDSINSDQILFFLTGGNRSMQLTRNFQPVNAAKGATFLPGGLILQWGTITAAAKNALTAASFQMDFPFACYSLQATLSAGTSGSVITVIPNSPTINGFSYFINTSSSQSLNFTWMALGN